MSDKMLPFLIANALRSLAVLLIAIALTRAARRRSSAATRHAAWVAAFGATLLLPVSAMFGPTWTLPTPARSVGVTVGSAPAMSREVIVPSAVPVPRTRGIGRQIRSTAERTAETPRIALFFQLVWMFGALACLADLVAGRVRARLLVRRSRAVTDPRVCAMFEACRVLSGSPRGVGLRLAREPLIPFLDGLVRRVIVIPQSATTWSDVRLRAVLMHELAHARRWDAWSVLLIGVTRSLFWMNPLVWYGASEARREMEEACDDLVLRNGTPSPDYAQELLALAQACSAFPNAGLAVVRASALERRIVAVLDDRRARGVSRRGVAIAASLLLIAQLGVAAIGVSEARASSVSHSITPRTPTLSNGNSANSSSARGISIATAVATATESRHNEVPTPPTPDGVARVRLPTLSGVCGRGVPDEITFSRSTIADTDDCRHGMATIDIHRESGRITELHVIVGAATDDTIPVGEPSQIVSILALVRSLDAHTASNAIQAAALILEGASSDELARLARSDSLAPEARRMAVTWLGIVGGAKATGDLATLARDSGADVSVREQALIALDDQSVPVALEIAANDPDARARAMALHRASLRLDPRELAAGLRQAIR
jgi:beta-lactamase regulating signal transducer with metallopeptidase domain